jgi:hypothetical protein
MIDSLNTDSGGGAIAPFAIPSKIGLWGMAVPLRRLETFDPENRHFYPAYPGCNYLTRGGQETVARAEYLYKKRYYQTTSETSVEHDE